jgi:MPBQ/MSBQ methyltransferase
MDALAMEFPDNSFDLVWACESGEHMPDKKQYVEEMTRVLKPGGRIVIATWCQRDDSEQPFTPAEEKKLDFLYSEWTHPHFISIQVSSTVLVCAALIRCAVVNVYWLYST